MRLINKTVLLFWKEERRRKWKEKREKGKKREKRRKSKQLLW